MKSCILVIDLGTTNFKFTLFDQDFSQISQCIKPVSYIESDGFIEFDVDVYFQDVINGILAVLQGLDPSKLKVDLITLTGQAESLIVTDAQGKALCRGISWKDSRSEKEARAIADFAGKRWYPITGLPEVTTTWPVTKLLWIKNNNPFMFSEISRIYLLKDYITYRLSGSYVSEYSVFSFSGLLDLTRRTIWKEMIDYLGISDSMLPELVEVGMVTGTLTPLMANTLNLDQRTEICVGALDHVAGMVGTGNITKGKITASLGTVNALALNIDSFSEGNCQIECHHGVFPRSIIQLMVIESGGSSMQWFRDVFMPSTSFSEIDCEVAKAIGTQNNILYLPYICGVNPPENDTKATGVFYGFDIGNDSWHFARAVLEANGFLLRKNFEDLENRAQHISDIYVIGGASNSPFFCQLLADITGKRFITFKNPESVSLGAAILGFVATGLYGNIEEAISICVKYNTVYEPRPSAYYAAKYDRFIKLYSKLFPVNVGT